MIKIFEGWMKTTFPEMDELKKRLKSCKQTKMDELKGQSDIVGRMLRFEELAMDFLTEGDMDKRMFTHPNSGGMAAKADATALRWVNPYLESYVWLKGEILDLKGMKDAL